ncbi:MAG: tRNA (adenosine(37)-N6)-threonylcarbamoyltransferase complex ATPase subunit type 1 TsaE [Nitrospirae bacterium]|nr:tRNA (adenosine(37)-N6)-threonylcarbamoyltransferase complex ATPase subunit type 1 TsaE [Nitrospirota bacterium]
MILQSKSDAETREIGKRLGVKLGRGDVVCLYGELGSGKTTMAKGIASALGIDEREITSPSFIIISEHSGKMRFNHIDLYRLSGSEISGLGLHEHLGKDGISVVEWAERAEDEMPDNAIKIKISHAGGDARIIDIEGISL